MSVEKLSRSWFLPLLGLVCMASKCNSQRMEQYSNNYYDPAVYEEIKFYVNELEVINNHFLQELDKILFSDELGKLNDPMYRYFYVQIQDDTTTTLYIQFMKAPSIRSFGYFLHNDYIFMVSGVNLRSLFSATQTYSEFSAWIHRRDLDAAKRIPPPPPEGFPMWILEYRDGQLFLILKEVW